jgi:hypothetical protein
MIIDLSRVSGALRHFTVLQDGEWMTFEHRRSGETFPVYAPAAYSLWKTMPNTDAFELCLLMLPPLCEQCGLQLTDGESVLCEVCLDVEIDNMRSDLA